jgi:23S rRNA pseudouridine1911/1915/1917 synthase
MDESRRYVVRPDEEGTRLDRFCSSRMPDHSRSQFQKLNASGRIAVNARERADHHVVHAGDIVEVRLPAADGENDRPVPQDIPLCILYEDDDLIVINKSAGIVVHPAHGNRDGTIVNALLGRGTRLASLGGVTRPGIVHRLDKDTSGVLVVAKSNTAYAGLADQIKSRTIEKVYHAIIWGNLGVDGLTVDRPIGRHPSDRKKMAVVSRGGKQAISQMFVVDSFIHFEYIRVVLNTGRTHQIRVHLSSLSRPILGDPVYGGRKKKASLKSQREKGMMEKLLSIMERQALHASSISFSHPVTGKRLAFRSALPADMRLTLETLFIEDHVQGG